MTNLVKAFIYLFGFGILVAGAKPASAFNLLSDIDTQTNWDLGKAAAAGTSIILRSDSSTHARGGQYVGSALAEISDYRFLSLWGGGTFIPQPDGTLRALDTAKIGLNLGYFLKGMVNQPPAIIQNLVFGPSLLTTLVTEPHIVIPAFDINVRFGS